MGLPAVQPTLCFLRGLSAVTENCLVLGLSADYTGLSLLPIHL